MTFSQDPAYEASGTPVHRRPLSDAEAVADGAARHHEDDHLDKVGAKGNA